MSKNVDKLLKLSTSYESRAFEKKADFVREIGNFERITDMIEEFLRSLKVTNEKIKNEIPEEVFAILEEQRNLIDNALNNIKPDLSELDDLAYSKLDSLSE